MLHHTQATPPRLTLTLTLAVTLLAAVPTFGRQVGRDGLPPGQWTFSAGPYAGRGHDTAPVDVYQVTSNAERGLSIVGVSLTNHTSEDVTGIRLRWYLKDADQNRVLSKGDTELLGIDLPAGMSQTLKYPVVSFARIHKPLLRDGLLSGNFRVEIAVSQVRYAERAARGRGGA